MLNPSETFGEIIVDYNHVECSSACITALTAFGKQFPEHRAAEIARALKRGVSYIKRWAGAWLCGGVMLPLPPLCRLSYVVACGWVLCSRHSCRPVRAMACSWVPCIAIDA